MRVKFRYYYLDFLIPRFVCDDLNLTLSENEICQSWVVDRSIYHCCIYRINLYKPVIEVFTLLSLYISHSLLLPRIIAMDIMSG